MIRIVAIALICGALYLALLGEVQRLDDQAVAQLEQLGRERGRCEVRR